MEDNVIFARQISPTLARHLPVVHETSLAAARRRIDSPTLVGVVCDLRLPDGTGFDLVAELDATRPEVGVVVCSATRDEATVDRATGHGATCISKFRPRRALDRIAAGWAAAARVATLPPTFRVEADEFIARHGLRGRPAEVLRLAAQRLRYAEMAERLTVSVSTIESHAGAIKQATGRTLGRCVREIRGEVDPADEDDE